MMTHVCNRPDLALFLKGKVNQAYDCIALSSIGILFH